MQSDEFERFRALVTKHYELYPLSQMTQATVSAWWDELVDIPLASVIHAFEKSRQAGDVDQRSGQPVIPACSRVKALANLHAQMTFDAHRRQKQIARTAEKDGCTLDPENPWFKLATYWEQENAHWEKHPSERPADVGAVRWKQWHRTEKLADEWKAKRDASASAPHASKGSSANAERPTSQSHTTGDAVAASEAAS